MTVQLLRLRGGDSAVTLSISLGAGLQLVLTDSI